MGGVRRWAPLSPPSALILLSYVPVFSCSRCRVAAHLAATVACYRYPALLVGCLSSDGGGRARLRQRGNDEQVCQPLKGLPKKQKRLC